MSCVLLSTERTLDGARRLLIAAAIGLVVLVLGLGCGSSGSPAGNDDDDDEPPALGTIYIDASNAGFEDGTEAHPYNTIWEGMDVATRGDTLIVAAGSYGGRQDEEIDVPVVVKVLGAGFDETVVDAYFVVSAPEDSVAVLFKHMAFDGVAFSWGNRPGARRVTDWHRTPSTASRGAIDDLLSPRVEYAPVHIDSCDAGFAAVSYPPDHTYIVENSLVDSLVFDHAATLTRATRTIRDCLVAGNISFTHGGGDARTTIENCAIGGAIWMRNGSGATFTITENTVHGIIDKSGANFTTISHNMLPTGDVIDTSGGWGQESQFIEHNDIQNGIIENRSGCATVRYNTVNAPADTYAIQMNCGAPANLVGNTVTLPGAGEPTGDPGDWRNVGILAICGEGVITGNEVTGGSIGIWDVSGATELSENVVSASHWGIVAGYGNGKAFTDNTVSNCVSDGVRFLATGLGSHYGAFEDNFITNNGGAGVRLFCDVDMGGGAQGAWGGNVLTGNAGYDLYIEVPSDSAAVIYAERNTWDHGSEGGIDSLDIYDANDDPSLADVDMMPLAN